MTPPVTTINPQAPEWYINRELSALAFHQRVFQLVLNPHLPLLERLRFLFICIGNLDEFFEVRVAEQKNQLLFSQRRYGADDLSPRDTLTAISLKVHDFVHDIYRVYNDELIPALRQQDIIFLHQKEWTAEQISWVKHYFRMEILPLVSPIGLDLAHPFPRLVNKSLNYIVSLTGKDAFGRDSGLAIVHVPRSIPRLIQLPPETGVGPHTFVLVHEIINAHVGEFFGGMHVTGCYQFRVTRNSDLTVDEDHTENLATALKTGLFARRYGMAVRLEISADCPEKIANFLLEQHKLDDSELYRVNGPVNLGRLNLLFSLVDCPELRYPPYAPGLPSNSAQHANLFEAIRSRDIFLYHPYHSFLPVIELVKQAASDPEVLAIKLTLYRTDVDSPMAKALVDAALAGKQVVAVIELRARFDEEHNIELATKLQEAGAIVVYGVVGFKTHAKMMLIIRREGKRLRRYAHIGTGNYHGLTAKQYTDIGLLTYHSEITSDVSDIFQQLTGMGKPIKLKKVLQAPFTLYKTLQELIQFEIAEAKAGREAAIMLKMNSLTEAQLISALYAASAAGVKISLIVRGICCLRPQVLGLSENIIVRSIVGRFLEHSRVYYFHHAGSEMVYAGSADWMERNLFHRVEVCFPIEDKIIAQQIKEDVLLAPLHDTEDSFELHSDGTYVRVKLKKGQKPYCWQQAMIEKYAYSICL